MTASGAAMRDFAGRVHGKSAVELGNISGVQNARIFRAIACFGSFPPDRDYLIS